MHPPVFLKTMNRIFLILLLMTTALSACSMPVDAPPLPTALSTNPPPENSPQPLPPTAVPSFCNDEHPRELLSLLQTALQTKDGASLATLISPTLGLDVIYIRNGNVLHYDPEHAKFIFETTFAADWGLAAGSGEPVIGSFQEIVLPSLQQVFTDNAIRSCGEIKTGGVTYLPQWPYPKMGYYSVYLSGTESFGNMDWQTWLAGISFNAEKPYLAVLLHFAWEP